VNVRDDSYQMMSVCNRMKFRRIDSAMAHALPADACRDHALVTWGVSGICQPTRSDMRRGY
jgi:hypothetical protein